MKIITANKSAAGQSAAPPPPPGVLPVFQPGGGTAGCPRGG